MRTRSIFVSYVDDAETCCSEGHGTQLEALRHASDVRAEREARRRSATPPPALSSRPAAAQIGTLLTRAGAKVGGTQT